MYVNLSVVCSDLLLYKSIPKESIFDFGETVDFSGSRKYLILLFVGKEKLIIEKAFCLLLVYRESLNVKESLNLEIVYL